MRCNMRSVDTDLSHFTECSCCIAQSTWVIGQHSGVSSKINIHQLNLYPRMYTFDGKLVFHSLNNLISYGSPLKARDATRTPIVLVSVLLSPVKVHIIKYIHGMFENGLL